YPCEVMSPNKFRGFVQLGFGQGHMGRSGRGHRMIPEPGDANREVNVTKTFHLQTDDELSDKELKQIEADDQAIQNSN
nr:hypothetical protein [Tanacetum cinerariifolium]